MRVFFEACFSPSTLPFTVLLILVFLYWIFMIIGAVDLEILDSLVPDFDMDDGGGLFGPLLQWMGIGSVPVMIMLSLFVFLGWAFSLIANTLIHPGDDLLLGFGMLVPIAVVSFFLAGLITRPLSGLFKSEKHHKIMYSIGVAATSTVTSDFGQVEIAVRGAPIVLNARTVGDAVIHKGEKVIVFDKDDDKGVYFVELFKE